MGAAVVSGIGIVSAFGHSHELFRDALLAGRSAVVPITGFGTSECDSTLAAEITVTEDDLKAEWEQHKAEFNKPEHRSVQVILTQDEASCIIYGMPRSVVEAGLSDQAVPLSLMAEEISKRL